MSKSTEIAAIGDLPVQPTYEQIRELERELLKMPRGEAPVTHHFADGIYGREILIPAGTMLTGKIHRFATLNILAKGEISVTTPEGIKRLVAPAVFVSPAGCKKVGFAHTDTVWINVHPSKLTNLDDLEAKFIVPEPAIESQENPAWLGQQ